MKVMTLNINYYMTKHGSWNKRKENIANLVQEHNPDIILLQAVKQDPRIGGGIDQAAQLLVQMQTHMHYYYQSATTYQDDSKDGSAIISRYPFMAVDHTLLTLLPGLEDPNQRVLLTGLLETPFGPLRVFNAHFSWVYEQAALNVEEARAYLANFTEPALFAGDFNITPETDILDGFREDGWMDVWGRLNPDNPGYTFEAPNPNLRIDYIWITPSLFQKLRGIEILVHHGVDPTDRLSDHLGLLAVFNM
jgi:endonuclease/exonuclease/phosphatase family metal-dependent hydrolase